MLVHYSSQDYQRVFIIQAALFSWLGSKEQFRTVLPGFLRKKGAGCGKHQSDTKEHTINAGWVMGNHNGPWLLTAWDSLWQSFLDFLQKATSPWAVPKVWNLFWDSQPPAYTDLEQVKSHNQSFVFTVHHPALAQRQDVYLQVVLPKWMRQRTEWNNQIYPPTRSPYFSGVTLWIARVTLNPKGWDLPQFQIAGYWPDGFKNSASPS